MDHNKKEDIKQEVFDLYDDYTHNRIDRRDFAQRVSTYAVGSITVASLMSFLMPDHHGFHNDTTPRYDKVAAELACNRTTAFFMEKLTK